MYLDCHHHDYPNLMLENTGVKSAMEIEFGQKVIQVDVGRHRVVKLPLATVQNTFHFTILDNESYNTDLFTIMLYDLDAPKGIYLHYLAVNYKITNHDDGYAVVNYYPPQRADHRYIYEVYLQSTAIIKKHNGVPVITPFDLDRYVKYNGLKRYATLTVETQETLVVDNDSKLPPVSYHGFVHDLTGPNAKYCTCVIEAEFKGSAVNPYAVCTKSTHGHMSECGSYYDYDRMPLEYLLVFTDKHHLHVKNRSSRSSAIQAIKEWKMRTDHKL